MKISIEQHADAGSDTLYMTVTVANAAPSLDLKQILNYELPLLADPLLVSPWPILSPRPTTCSSTNSQPSTLPTRERRKT